MKIPQAQTSGLQLACAEGQGEPRAPPLQPSWCTAEAGMRKEVSAAPDGVSLRLMQPQTDSGVSSIITPLSLWDLSRNEACFLPGAISFYPGWRLKADQWGNNVWCHFHYSDSLPSSQSVWNTQKDQFFPKMVKKCFGSMHLPEKHSLLYLSMLLRQELFTQSKTEEMGEGEKSQILL